MLKTVNECHTHLCCQSVTTCKSALDQIKLGCYNGVLNSVKVYLVV